MSKQSKSSKGFVTFLKYVLIVLLMVGVVGIVIRFASCEDDITGMYIKYGDKSITAGNDVIAVDYSETQATTFTIANNDGWGNYSVTECTVTVINNVSSSSVHDFEYIVDGANLPNNFSDITDFTSVFATDGNSVTVNSDGIFELTFKYETMSEILQTYYGKAVTVDGTIDLYGYPYFAIQIISPDEAMTITIPFVYSTNFVTDITITPDAIAF
ncbi:MAG: hypothetical protein LUD27_03060 [Clostridia bacterium]|nr:hypothetical protein [Clostridia bacterium]